MEVLVMVLVVLVVLGDLVDFLLMAQEGLVALHLVVSMALEVFHLLEVLEGLVVCLLVVLVVPVVLAVPMALEVLLLDALVVLILEINPTLANFPVVLPHSNLFINQPMALLVISCHINITSMCSPIDSYLSLQLWTCLICPS